MTAPLPVLVAEQCWHKIGVWGDRSCPELAAVTHCHNCPVFAAAGRRFLDAPSPPDYLDEWTDRLATADDASYAIFELTGGVIAQINSSWCVRVHRDELVEFQVDGTEGSAVAGLRNCRVQHRSVTPKPV